MINNFLMISLVAGSLAIVGLGCNGCTDAGAVAQNSELLRQDVEAALQGKSKGSLGERCWRDNDCYSRECKGFKCVKRKKRLLPNGSKCWFDGDCLSGECHKWKCVPR